MLDRGSRRNWSLVCRVKKATVSLSTRTLMTKRLQERVVVSEEVSRSLIVLFSESCLCVQDTLVTKQSRCIYAKNFQPHRKSFVFFALSLIYNVHIIIY